MKSQAGFTLLEVLTALLFVGIVGGAFAGVFTSALQQQHRAAELEYAHTWLQAEVLLQHATALNGPCQSNAEYEQPGWQCTVHVQVTGDMRLAHIVLTDHHARTIGEVLAVAEPR